MTNKELFAIFFAEPTPTMGLRAVFNAGVESARNGDDQLADLDINDCLQAHAEQRNYMTRAG